MSERTRSGTGMWAAVAALCLIQFVDVMSVTVVLTALPQMLDDLQETGSSGTLISTSYAMFFGGLLMFGARAGDRIGHRRSIMISIGAFAVGALIAATATSGLTLAAARAIQGASAAVAVPSALTLLTAVTGPGPARARAVAAWSAVGAAAGGTGLIVGGLIVNVGSWRVIFWGFLGLSVVLLAVMVTLVPADVLSGEPKPLNLLGSFLLTVSVMLLVVGTTLLGEPSHRTAGVLLVCAAAVVLMLFVRVDRRSTAPLLPRAELRRPQVLHGTAGAFFNNATTGGAAILLTLYLQDTLGRSPLETAQIFLPFSVLVVGGSALAARLIVKMYSERVAAAGLGLIGIGLAAPLLDPASVLLLGICLGVTGFGLGLSSVATTSLATDVPEKPMATDSGIVNTSAQLGTAIGTAVVLYVAAVTSGIPASNSTVPYLAWALPAIVAALVAISFVLVNARRRRGDLYQVRRAPARRRRMRRQPRAGRVES